MRGLGSLASGPRGRRKIGGIGLISNSEWTSHKYLALVAKNIPISIMKFFPNCPVCLVRLAVVIFGISMISSRSLSFEPVPEEQLALTEPKIDPEAAAEYFFYEAKASDDIVNFYGSSSKKVTFRLKVFKERAIQEMTPFKIFYPIEFRISGLKARVTKPDGTEVYLEKEDTETESSQHDEDYTLKVTSFSFPNLEVGDVLDFAYKLDSLDTVYRRTMFSMHLNFPSHHSKMMFKPMSYPGMGLTYQTFKNADKNWVKKAGDYYVIEGRDLPASKDEKFAIPKLHRVPSVWYIYRDGADPGYDKFWEETGQKLYREANGDFKPSKAIEAELKRLTEGSGSKLESLKRVYHFCQDEIANTAYGYGEISKVEREALPKDQSANQVLSNAMGRPPEIRKLFGSFARALGFEVQYSRLPDNRVFFFNPGSRFLRALPIRGVAVKISGEWQVLRPSNPHVAFGEVEPWSSGSNCLIGNKKKEAIFVKSPKGGAAVNIMERSGSLTLKENGDLKGEIEITAYGDFARGLRNRHHASTEEEWGKALVRLLRRTFKSEFTHSETVEVENKRGSSQPIKARFSVTIPGYAERSGDRLVVRPSVFWDNWEPRFDSEKRESTVSIISPSTIVDKIEIVMPEGYVFEGGAAPKSLPDNNLMVYKANIKIDPKKAAILFERTFAEKFSTVVAKYYPALRKIESYVFTQDASAITLAPKS